MLIINSAIEIIDTSHSSKRPPHLSGQIKLRFKSQFNSKLSNMRSFLQIFIDAHHSINLGGVTAVCISELLQG